MTMTQLLSLPFSANGVWRELKGMNLSIPFLAWVIVVPMSFLPPVLLYYAGTHYGDSFINGFADKEWRFITTILFLAELLMAEGNHREALAAWKTAKRTDTSTNEVNRDLGILDLVSIIC